MTLLDWILFGLPILVVFGFIIYAQRFVRNVADFLVASRSGGRYLLTADTGIAAIGVITFVAALESYHEAGWGLSWWSQISVPVGLILSLTGFVLYRYRQTRVLTMAQFFEVRYSRRYRVVMGILCYISGILNFGIFPAITTRFFMDFMQLPEYCGSVPLYPVLMLTLIGAAAVISISGGQLQNMVADTVSALFSYGICVAVAIAVFFLFSVDDFKMAMTSGTPGHSLVNPFDATEIRDFNIYLILIGIFRTVYTRGAWLGNQGYAGAALTPHESKMSGILSTWRQISLTILLGTVSLGALTYLKTHPEFQVIGADGVTLSAPKHTMVAAIAEYMPVGIKGLFAVQMFFFMFSTDSSYLHSWGSILIQDIVLPSYGKPISQKTHLLLLRLSIGFVALFAMVFSLCYRQSDFIVMFQIATGAVFTAAGGCAIIGGLYWKYGTAAGAWCSMVTGVTISLFSVWMQDQRGWFFVRENLISLFGQHPFLVEATDKCPVNGAWLGFIAMIGATVVYVVISLLTCKEPFNLDRMLHRNEYAEKNDVVNVPEEKAKIAKWKQLLLGFDHEFTKSDKWVSVSVFVWVMFWFGTFVVISLWNLIGIIFENSLIRPWTASQWFDWMMVSLVAQLVLAPVTAVWLAWGGARDLFVMFKVLKNRTQSSDDGYVPETAPEKR